MGPEITKKHELPRLGRAALVARRGGGGRPSETRVPAEMDTAGIAAPAVLATGSRSADLLRRLLLLHLILPLRA